MTRFIQFTLAAVVLAIGTPVSAQSLSAEATREQPRGAMIPGPDALLWDNTNINSTTAGTISSLYSSLPSNADMVNIADDFVVPGGEQWSIRFVYSTGFSNNPTPADSFEIIFYADDGGLPGTEVSRQNIPLGGAVSMETQELTLANPVTLGPGTHWVSVVGVYDTATDPLGGRWNWRTGDTSVGSEYYLQDLAGFFGGVLPWTTATDLGLSTISTFFALRGTSAPLAPPVAVPTLGSAGLLVLALLLLFTVAGVSRRLL